MTSRSFTILLVSPDRAVLRRLTRFLGLFGYEVRQATDGETALAAAEAAQPDFLILDGSSGQPADLQLCYGVRRLWPGGSTYSLLLADRFDTGDITAALEAGFDDFLTAPLVFGELLARLRAGARRLEFERRLAEQSPRQEANSLPGKAALAAAIAERSKTSKGAIGWLALIDLDHFRRAMDRLGRLGADELLNQAASLLRQKALPDHLVVSFGQDRFAVLLTSGSEQVAVSWCEEALSELADAPFTANEQAYRLTASCGLAEVAAGQSLAAIEEAVQPALEMAKSSGRNCVVSAGHAAREAELWNAEAADGKLFATTTARDVMHPCPLVLSADDTWEQAHAALMQAKLLHAPVIDAEQRLVGLVALDEAAGGRPPDSKPRASGPQRSSTRLVRHMMETTITRFPEDATLAELMEHFTESSAALAVIVRGQKPQGLVHCQALAALNERLAAEQFCSPEAPTGTSADLVVADLALSG
jgi:two-component system chemotaxis response regulator CheY